MYMEDPSNHASESSAAACASSPSGVIVTWNPSQLLSAHQQMESSLVELLNLLTEWMMRRAARKREEARRNAALAMAAQSAHGGPAPAPSPSNALHGRSMSQSSSEQGAFAIAAATGARIHSARQTHQAQSASATHASTGMHAVTPTNALPSSPLPSSQTSLPLSDPEESVTFSSFLSHFHLLSHLIPQLRVSSLEHMLNFLLPDDAAGTSSSSNSSSSSRRGDPGMALCYSLLDAHTQTQLIELIVQAYLHIVHLREKTEVDEWEQDVPEKQEGEVEVSPGTEEPHSHHTESKRSSSNSARPSRTYQLRLLHVLYNHSGEYRLSHVLPRCVDYQNWIAAAVAIEAHNQLPTTTTSSSSGKQANGNSLQLASGLWRHGSGSHLSDAMECRLKHLNQRIQIWQQWKQRPNAQPLPVHPPHCVGSVEMIDVGCSPRFPSDVWLSFDEFSIETAQLFLQLVPSHLIHVVNIAEQARLLSLLLQGWRAVDLPSVVLESVLLSNLASLAEALSVLAFQPKANGVLGGNGHQRIAAETSTDSLATTNSLSISADASSPIVFAPIFSAKLYLALTHYRLNQVYRNGDNNNSGSAGSSLADSLSGISMRDTSGTGRGSTSPFAHSAPPLSSSPHASSGASIPMLPSSSQTQRLWSEILSNLHRDLDATGESNPTSSSGSSIVNSVMPTATTSSQLSAPTPASVSYLSTSAFLYKYAPISSATPSTSSPNAVRSSLSRTASQSVSPSESVRSAMVFTCGHAYLIAEFMSHVLPELLQQLCALSPPLPITANFLQAEYTHGVKPQSATDSAGIISTSRVCALACPCCVFASLLQLQQRRAQTVQKAAFMQQQQQNERLARMQQPSSNLTSVGHANVPSPSNMMLGSTSPSSASVPSPQQRKHAIGLSMAGNVPKLQFGRVSAADLTEDR